MTLEVPQGFMEFSGRCKTSDIVKDDNGDPKDEGEGEVVEVEEEEEEGRSAEVVAAAYLSISGNNNMLHRIGCFANNARGEASSMTVALIFKDDDTDVSWVFVPTSRESLQEV
jgi:hypothetical protein